MAKASRATQKGLKRGGKVDKIAMAVEMKETEIWVS
jgi:hypothetical protein